MVQQLSTNTFGVAKWIVSPVASDGTHTTIATAIADASDGDTIFIRPGTYTEDLTLKAGVTLTSFQGSDVNIVGTMTFTAAGTVNLSFLTFTTNSDFILEVTGSNASVVLCDSCTFLCTDNTGISHTSSSSGSLVHLISSLVVVSDTGITAVTSTSAGIFGLTRSVIQNPGGSTTASSFSAGSANITNSKSDIPFSLSGSALALFDNFTIETAAQNATSLTMDISGGTVTCRYSKFVSGTASAINIVSGQLAVSIMEVLSSNASAITGSGTLTYGRIVFLGSSSTIAGGITQGNFVVLPSSGGVDNISFLATHTVAQDDVTGNGTVVTVNFTTEIFDNGSDYDGTNTFTAPETGQYYLQGAVFLTMASSAFDLGAIRIVTSNRTYESQSGDYGNMRSAAIGVGFSHSVLADMDAADTCTITTYVEGGALTIDIAADGTKTYFSGFLQST